MWQVGRQPDILKTVFICYKIPKSQEQEITISKAVTINVRPVRLPVSSGMEIDKYKLVCYTNHQVVRPVTAFCS